MAQPLKTLNVFPSMLTNMFPVANDTNGGQLVTEWNIKQLESVMGDTQIRWAHYPSYTATEQDFVISAVGATEPYSLFIGKTGGLSNRAIIDGHFLEVLGRIRINLLSSSGVGVTADTPLASGQYEIGLVAVYSGDSTLTSQPPGRDSQLVGAIDGTTKLFGQSGIFGGVAVVIGSVSGENRLLTPSDCPLTTQRDLVNCHLKLGRFTWQSEIMGGSAGGRVVLGSVRNYLTEKLRFLDPERLIVRDSGNTTSPLVGGKQGLNPDKLYAYATRDVPGQEYNDDAWTDITFDLLDLPRMRVEYDQTSDRVMLVAPYKRAMHQEGLFPEPNFKFVLPNANPAFANNAGMLGKYYKSKIDELSKLNDALQRGTHASGTLKRVIPELTTYELDYNWNVAESAQLPNPRNFNAGDYVYILMDYLANDRWEGNRPKTQKIEATDVTSVPSTMRVVTLTPTAETNIVFDPTFTPNPPPITDALFIADFTIYVETMSDASGQTVQETSKIFSMPENMFVWGKNEGEEIIFVAGLTDIDDTSSEETGWGIIRNRLFTAHALDGLPASLTQATAIVKIVINNNLPGTQQGVITQYRGVRATEVVKDWSNALWLTPTLPIATYQTRGAVFSVDLENTDFQGKGYCYVDEFGYIRMVDFDYLESGGAWRFLQNDYETTAGQDIDGLRAELEVYVNRRASIGDFVVVVYLPDRQNPGSAASASEVLHLTIGSVYRGSTTLIFKGSADAIPVQLTNCDRIRVIDQTSGDIELALLNCELYYDAAIIQKCLTVGGRAGIFGMTLWYKEFIASRERVKQYPEVFRQEERDQDGRLIVIGSEYITCEAHRVEFHGNSLWLDLATFSDSQPEVNLQARISDVEFSPTGIITGLGLMIRNRTTTGDFLAGITPVEGQIYMMPTAVSFNSSGQFPEMALRQPIIMRGTLVTMYRESPGWHYLEIDVQIATESFETNTTTLTVEPRGGSVLLRFVKYEQIDSAIDSSLPRIPPHLGGGIGVNTSWDANTPIYIQGKARGTL